MDKKLIVKPTPVIEKDTDTEELLKAINRKKQNKQHVTDISYSELFNIADDLKQTSSTADDIYNLFPDIKLTIELMTSSILSPNDDLNTNINYNIPNVKLPISTSMIVTNTIKNYILEHYKLNDDMFDIIKDSMYIKGSYVKVVLPVASIVNLTNKYKIKTGYEDDITPHHKQIIDKQSVLNGMVTIMDDYDLLNIPDVKDQKVSSSVYSKIISGYEDDSTSNMLMLDTILDNDKRPIVKTIPHDKIIPIADNNDPSVHYGYLMILDSNGSSVNVNKGFDGNSIDVSMENSILSRAKKLVGNVDTVKPMLNNISGLRDYLIESTISKQLETNNILQNVSDDTFNQVGDILLSRFIEDHKSNILFIPKELVTYYAYEYNNNGTGRPMLDKISVLASMRAITLFVTLLAYVKSSISTTNVTVDIDEDDDDYEATMEKVMTEVMSNRQLNLPIGILKVDDLTDWLHKIGFSFNFSHPGLPDTKVEVSEDKNDIDPVNSDLLEKIDKQIIQALGATPEMVDNSNESDFATTIVNNNILFARRTITYQKVYNKHNTNHIKKILRLDTILKNEIIELLRSSLSKIKKYIIKDLNSSEKKEQIRKTDDDTLLQYIYSTIINKIEVTLPRPTIEDNTKLKDQFNDFKDNIDDVIESIFNSDVLPDEILGDFSDKIDSLQNLIKSILIKRWLTENDYMPEVTNMFTMDEDGIPMLNILEEFSDYTDSLEKTIIPFLKEMNKFKNKIDVKLEKIEEDTGEDDEEDNNINEDIDIDNSDDSGDNNVDNDTDTTDDPMDVTDTADDPMADNTDSDNDVDKTTEEDTDIKEEEDDSIEEDPNEEDTKTEIE